MSRFERVKNRYIHGGGFRAEENGMKLGAIIGGIVGLALFATQPITSLLVQTGLELGIAACGLAGAVTGVYLAEAITKTSYYVDDLISGTSENKPESKNDVKPPYHKPTTNKPMTIEAIRHRFRSLADQGQFGTNENYAFLSVPGKNGEELYIQHTCGHEVVSIVGQFAAATMRMCHEAAELHAQDEVKMPCHECQAATGKPQSSIYSRAYRR